MKVGIPREIAEGERRVAITPTHAARLIKLGMAVEIESGAGEAAGFDDASYQAAGAVVVGDARALYGGADLVLKVRPPMALAGGGHEADLLKEGGALAGFIWPATGKEMVDRLAARRATVFAMDAVPRITRAQKMDALSATANLAGYRAVLEAAAVYGRFFPGQMTAAGAVKPAQVFILGAGVAGLAAIAAAKALGAQVRAFDTRPEVREQVESLGAQFVPLEFDESGSGEGGYARQMSDAFLAAEQALIAQHAKQVDVVISTALIPGKKAPLLITEEAVGGMRRGSVIVDLAAEQGGNCALTEPGRVADRLGVKIIGYTDLASRMALQASELYSATLFNLIEDLVDDKGQLAVDLDDEIHRGCIVLQEGKWLWPPPARPKPPAKPPARPAPSREAHKHPHAAAHAPPPPGKAQAVIMAMAGLGLLLLGERAPREFLQHVTVFVLSCVVGWHVVWNVTPALHTPLMSVTNAISGIILLGGLLLARGSSLTAASALGAVAVLLATINVAGGFLVTQRMLRMFRR